MSNSSTSGNLILINVHFFMYIKEKNHEGNQPYLLLKARIRKNSMHLGTGSTGQTSRGPQAL